MRLHFGDFCFDTDRREVSKTGTPIHLTSKALQLLEILLKHRPKVLPKEQIYGELWPDTFVEESNLSVLISEIRSALGDDARRPRFIKTAHGYGYGFVAEVRSAPAQSPIRLRSASREFDLIEGDNIVGRDPAADVRLQADGISRRHARITISAGQAIIEDLGSKNGTYVGGKRINRPRTLQDGDEIRLSRELLVVVIGAPLRSTVTDLSSSST